MGGILVGVLAAVRLAHQIQDLIIVVLPVCPVQAQSRLGIFWNTRGNHEIGMTGQTSGLTEAYCSAVGGAEVSVIGAAKNRPDERAAYLSGLDHFVKDKLIRS